MGHKVHPNAFRLGVFRPWEANWFANPKDYTKMLHEDLEMRRTILARLRNAGIAKIETERSSNAQLTVTIHTAKPGIVIGKGGSSVDQLREDLEKRFGNRVRISIQEIKQPELDAQLVAENIASQIERRISYKRAMKQAILRTMRSGAKGVRVYCGGRLRGAEMARREWDREGRVPLHTLRADIDFGRATAKTTFGAIGVKCWIYKDQISPQQRRLAIADGAPIGEAIAPQPELPEPPPPPRTELVEPVVATPEMTAEAPAAPAAPARRPRPTTTTTARPRTAAAPKSAPAAAESAGPTRTSPRGSTGAKAAPRPKATAKPTAEKKAAPAKKTTAPRKKS
ncbi:MAG TPA: 30S ribosomal protein S3 [Candidatus Dormibacteraeota bacterium]|nr:30S ribosomal protein S3 [Candidatus Dormibacteraeota bacterium]